MTLTILSAGVAKQLVQDTARKWDAAHPDCPAEFQIGGSVDLAREIIAGEPCDFFISADDTLISAMLIPRYAGECTVFARNSMVIACARGGAEPVTGGNWKEKLLAPDARFAHYNPYADPGGYRGVMCILLADKAEQGLSAKLMNHPGHIGMDKNLTKDTLPPHDYLFMYHSGAAASGLPFAELPAVMNLGDPACESVYNSVSFIVQGGNEKITIKGTHIRHACVIPKAARHPDEAREFQKLFMASDFAAYNFR